MKILYIAGESANWALNICNKICEKGHEVHCIVQESDTYDKNVSLHKNLTKVIYDSNMVLPNNFDIVFGSHVPTLSAVKYLSNALGIPFGFMILDVPADLIVNEPMRQRQWNSIIEILKDAKAIVFNTRVAQNEYIKLSNETPNGKFFVIPYGINLMKKFKNSGIEKKGAYVISVCRLTPLKNCSIIPDALNYLNLKNVNNYTAIGRDGGELELIRKKSEKFNLQFNHYTEVSEEKKNELIRDSKMLIYPQKTPYIGGLSPLEAMYIGKPVIVPDLPILRDLYKNYGNYVRNDNFGALANEIAKQWSKTPDIEFLKKASDFVEREYSYKTMVNQLEEVFNKIK